MNEGRKEEKKEGRNDRWTEGWDSEIDEISPSQFLCWNRRLTGNGLQYALKFIQNRTQT